jgi:diguanylate cyclase (GGDEF)-like protein
MNPNIARLHPDPATADDAFLAMATPALLLDSGGRVVLANEQACAMLGCAPTGGAALAEILARCGVDGAVVFPDAKDAVNGCRVGLSDGRIVSVEARILPGGGSVLTLNDVSAFVRESELARLDPLTGLANRITFHARLDQLIRSRTPAAIFCVDLDRFKSVNDTLGHPVGDALLRKVAERLLGLVRAQDMVARLGGDEFALLVPDMIRPEPAEALASRMVDLVGRTYALEGHVLNVSASIGVALAPADGSDADVLLKNADLALYRAKADGRDRFRFFEPVMDARMQERRAMEIELRRALAFKEFSVAYQPQVNLATGEVVGFEALLRWENPRLHLPGGFRPRGGGIWADRADRRMGAAHRLRRGRGLGAAGGDRGQPLSDPAAQPQADRHGHLSAGAERARSRTARARDHRNRPP